MRVLISILAGFLIGVLLLGTGLDWLLDTTAGECTTDCASWRHWLTVIVTVSTWAASAYLFHRTWERIKPEMAPSATEERIRHLRRGGR